MKVYTIGSIEEKCGGMQTLYTEVSIKHINYPFGLTAVSGFPPVFSKKEEAEEYMKTFVERKDLCVVILELL